MRTNGQNAPPIQLSSSANVTTGMECLGCAA